MIFTFCLQIINNHVQTFSPVLTPSHNNPVPLNPNSDPGLTWNGYFIFCDDSFKHTADQVFNGGSCGVDGRTVLGEMKSKTQH